MLLGGTTWTAQAVGDIAAFAEANRLATASTFRRQDRIDNLHPCYAGDLAIGPSPKLAERVREADLIIAVGSRLGEIVSSSYTLFDVPRPRQTLAHVHGSGRVGPGVPGGIADQRGDGAIRCRGQSA